MSNAYDENKALDQALTLLEVAKELLINAWPDPAGDYLRDREREGLLTQIKAETRDIAYRVDRLTGKETP